MLGFQDTLTFALGERFHGRRQRAICTGLFPGADQLANKAGIFTRSSQRP
jgi:hypothetical protein